ncbi:MAG: hypothetical protein AAB477_00655 [Patescibacteria group bacterium]
METKTCVKCKNSFIIEPEDKDLYSRLGVPITNKCFECRKQHLYAFRNERKLYRRNCDLCSKSTVTIYSKDKPFKVYCPPCFWSDNWDAKDYAQEFDFSKPFFEQFRELQLKAPRMALLTKNSVNSEYTNHSGENKNCYLSFATFASENVLHSSDIWNRGQDIMDCAMITDSATLCYECVDCEKINSCQFCLLVKESNNCSYSYDLKNCNDCFLCYNLRNKSFCILNKQYTREQYQEEIKKYDLASRSSRKLLWEAFIDMMTNFAVHKAYIIEKSSNCTGNMLYNSKNTKYYFDAEDVEDCRYSVQCPNMKDSIDNYHVGLPVTQYVYSSHGVIRSTNITCCHLSYDNTYISYCDSCQNSNNLFGCVSIKKGSYCILNKQYSKEEYEELVPKIKEHMKSTGEWGSFFPISISPVCYNETLAQIHMPLSKDEALSQGFTWQDDLEGIYGKETIKEIPDLISDVDESMVKEVLKCSNCSKNYNIIQAELELYQRMKIPVPDQCPDCRYISRISLRLPYKLWSRSCMCDKSNHGHQGKCPSEFETSYAPERPEIIYCEQCYQQEVI